MSQNREVRSALLDRLSWLEHGFGTRESRIPDRPMATVKQVHSVEILTSAGMPGVKGEADAILNETPGLAIGVKTADCVPILIADPEHRVVAAVHAGWRGTAREITRLTLERMTELYKTNPIDVFVGIGPSIDGCCFEVGPEVAREFSKWDSRLAETGTHEKLDLPGLNTRQLLDAGVPEGNIDAIRMCTMCRMDWFYSFRKEKTQGRQMSWIGIKLAP